MEHLSSDLSSPMPDEGGGRMWDPPCSEKVKERPVRQVGRYYYVYLTVGNDPARPTAH